MGMDKNNKFSYSDYYQYYTNVNIFEKNIMGIIRELNSEKKIKHVGISVQFFEEIQDDFSPTRKHPEGMNSYCRNIQTDKLDKCNLFDIEAKNYYKNTLNWYKNTKNETKTKDLLCFCHAEVANHLFIFDPKSVKKYKDYTIVNEIEIFIFIGHFFLSQFPEEEALENFIFYDDSSEYKNINSFEPISHKKLTTDININEKYNKGDEKDLIYSANFTTLKNVKSIIIKKILEFLSNKKNEYIIINDNDKTITFSDKIVNISRIPTVDRIKSELRRVEKQIREFESVSIGDKNDFFDIKKTILSNIVDFKTELYPLKMDNEDDENDLKNEDLSKIEDAYNAKKFSEIYNWLIISQNGSVGTRKWLKNFPLNNK